MDSRDFEDKNNDNMRAERMRPLLILLLGLVASTSACIDVARDEILPVVIDSPSTTMTAMMRRRTDLHHADNENDQIRR